MLTHSEKVLRLLSDGEPHTHMEGYRLGVMLHSRVADLRKKGHAIRCWREGDQYLYQLAVGEAGNALGCGVHSGPLHQPPELPGTGEQKGPEALSASPRVSPGHQPTLWEAA